jgi:hypothetical protein
MPRKYGKLKLNQDEINAIIELWERDKQFLPSGCELTINLMSSPYSADTLSLYDSEMYKYVLIVDSMNHSIKKELNEMVKLLTSKRSAKLVI